MREPRTRLTAVLKTDIAGYTDRTATMSKVAIGAWLDQHKTVADSVFKGWGGVVIKGEGDAFWVVFDSVRGAIGAALGFIAALRDADDLAQVKYAQRTLIRAAITSGDVLFQEGDIFGPVVNLTARLEAQTPPRSRCPRQPLTGSPGGPATLPSWTIPTV
jgi:class 3 adenylate cyclase